MDKKEKVEHSLTKRFRTDIWRKFIKGISDYDLIQEGDKIAVCISGGKDSMLLAKCMQELKKHWNVSFELEFFVMDPGYNAENRKKIEENASILGIPVKIFNSDIFEIVENIKESPCYLCARMRRGYLYKFAKELGCNKIALGHHFNDVIETIIMSMFYASEYKTMMPKLKSTNFEGMELIRPLYLVKEENIIKWKNYNELEFIACACRMTKAVYAEDGSLTSKRQEIKELLAALKKNNDNIDINIFRSIHKVNLSTVLGYVKDGKHISFLDEY